jgi:hypothetical protein
MLIERNLKRIIVLLLTGAVAFPLLAEDTPEAKKDAAAKTDPKKSDEEQMMATMTEMAKPGEPHKQMQDRVGTWSYRTKWWMNPEAPPSESSGTSVTRSIMDGRYLVSDHTGKIQMPGPDGKMVDLEFKGMAIEGYDNAKKKYVASWIDNMGTGIMNLEGTYNPADKALTYYAEYEPMPGMKMKIREVLTKMDNDHHRMEFFEDRGGKDVKTMQIDYTRKS